MLYKIVIPSCKKVHIFVRAVWFKPKQQTEQTIINIELNDLKKIIYLRKYEVSVKRISVFNVTEIQCLPWFYTNDIINMLP